MTADGFRRLALALPHATPGAHMAHEDFRVGGKIFATLGYPDAAFGMVKLNAEQQALFMRAAPTVFEPANGAWGRRGCTIVRLRAARAALLADALAAAWRNTAPKRLVTMLDAQDSAPSRRNARGDARQ